MMNDQIPPNPHPVKPPPNMPKPRKETMQDEISRLKAEVKRLRPATFFTAVPCEEYDKLKAEVEDLTVGLNDQGHALLRLSAENERLRKAGDEMETDLRIILFPNAGKCHSIAYWNAAKDGKPTA